MSHFVSDDLAELEKITQQSSAILNRSIPSSEIDNLVQQATDLLSDSSIYGKHSMTTTPLSQPASAPLTFTTYNRPSQSQTQPQTQPQTQQPTQQQDTSPQLTRSALRCDACPDESPRPARFYCRQCKGYFCDSCDQQFHPPLNKLMSKHSRLPVEQLRQNLFCTEHPEEELTYFCLDCECQCVCTECVVRGRHKDHDAQPIRKSYPIIRGKTNDLLSNLASRIDNLINITSRIESHKREIQENTQSVKDSMIQSFNEVRERLKKKETELLANADTFMETQINQLKEYIGVAQEKLQQIQGSIDEFKETIEKSDAVGFLNYYSSHKGGALTLLDETPVDIELPQIAARRCYLNMEGANQQIQSLNGLHLAIASLHEEVTGISETYPQQAHTPSFPPPASASASPPQSQIRQTPQQYLPPPLQPTSSIPPPHSSSSSNPSSFASTYSATPGRRSTTNPKRR